MSRFLPISFTGENAAKVHDGDKTQTRRIVKLPPGNWRFLHFDDLGQAMFADGKERCYVKPAYQAGDKAFVKEPWRLHWLDGETTVQFQDGSFHEITDEIAREFNLYSDLNEPFKRAIEYACEHPKHWRPSMFMLRGFHRTVVNVDKVRCARVDEISGADIRAEGMTEREYLATAGDFTWWRNLWNSINSAPGKRMEDRPFVFAYDIRRSLKLTYEAN